MKKSSKRVNSHFTSERTHHIFGLAVSRESKEDSQSETRARKSCFRAKATRGMMLTVVLPLLLLAVVPAQSKKSKLSAYNIVDVTLSGLSSGAYFAVQFHVAFSKVVNGTAAFAGGPFYCAESNLEYATSKCMATTLGGPDTSTLVALTNTDYGLDYIDNPAEMHNDRVYLFSGKDDTVVDPNVVHALQSYYMSFVKSGNVVADYNVPAEHCMPTIDYGEACSTLASPYIGNCNFDGAGQALKFLYPNANLVRSEPIAANLFAFDQTSYFSSSTASIGDVGYIYVPNACKEGAACHLHVSFHGCEQNLDKIGSAYAEHSGFNAWAEKSNIIVVYPYVKVSSLYPYNPKGCWDWWSYTGVDYGVKTGVQPRFVRAIISALGVPEQQ